VTTSNFPEVPLDIPAAIVSLRFNQSHVEKFNGFKMINNFVYLKQVCRKKPEFVTVRAKNSSILFHTLQKKVFETRSLSQGTTYQTPSSSSV
jgi:hypothetical protein